MKCGSCGTTIRLGEPFSLWDQSDRIRCKPCAEQLSPADRAKLGRCFQMTHKAPVKTLRKSKRDAEGQTLLYEMETGESC